MIKIIYALFGLALLTAGRKLYWLFVGVVGFVVGISLSKLLFKSESQWVLLTIALVAGVLGALLALFLQRLAVGAAGFFAGGYILLTFLEALGLGLPVWLSFLIGGIIGAALVAALFDWALVILSTLLGASLLVDVLPVSGWVSALLFAVLSLIGFGLQVAGMGDSRR